MSMFVAFCRTKQPGKWGKVGGGAPVDWMLFTALWDSPRIRYAKPAIQPTHKKIARAGSPNIAPT